MQEQIAGPGIPFRLRIGVTGHRRLPDPDELSLRINKALDVHIPGLLGSASRKQIQGSTRTPLAFTVLSPLAEGADRLVAETILKRPDSRIEVVLPLTVGDYLEDFESAQSHAEFQRLLGLARRPISLRETPLAADFLVADLAEARRQAYEDVGRYVVTHCDVLLALWDGKEARGRGGTEEVVRYAQSIARPVVVIVTEEPGEIQVYAGGGIRTEAFFEVEAFNSFAVPQADEDAYVPNMYRDLFENESGRGLPSDLKATVRKDLLPYYVRASMIAKRKQRFYMVAGSLAYSFAALAVAAVAAGALFLDQSPIVFGTESLILLTSLVTVVVANRRRTHKRWIESRFLAERLRAAVFLAACGLETSPISVSTAPGGRLRPGGWMEMVLNEILARMPALPGCSDDGCANATFFIWDVWIGGQIKFHKGKARKSRRLSRRMEHWGVVVFALALGAPLLHLLLFEPLNVVDGLALY
jgi:hypothetical protein